MYKNTYMIFKTSYLNLKYLEHINLCFIKNILNKIMINILKKFLLYLKHQKNK